MKRIALPCLLVAAACSPPGRPLGSDAGLVDAASRPSDMARAPDLAADPCAYASDGGTRDRVLACHRACALSMFTGTPNLVEEFDDPQLYASRWTGSYVAPTVAGGQLVFGPHPLTANWWENYSPTQTDASFGDVLMCATLKLTNGTSGANGMQMSLRGGSDGMVLGLSGHDGNAVLTTRTDPQNDVWTQHASVAFALPEQQPQSIEWLLWAHGNHFVAEVHDLDSGQLVAMTTDFTLPATGPAGLLGWELPNALYVDRVVIGTPAPDVAAILSGE